MDLISAISSTPLGLILISLTYVSAIPSTGVVESFPEDTIEDDITDTISKSDTKSLAVISLGGNFKESSDTFLAANPGSYKSHSNDIGGFGSGSSSDFGFGSSFSSSSSGGPGGGGGGGGSSGGRGGSDGESPDGESPDGESSDGESPDEDGSDEEIYDSPPVQEQTSSVALITIANPSLIQPGETVTYAYDVTNNGDSNLHCGPIIDDALGDVSVGDVGPLAPGNSVQFTSTANIFANTKNISQIVCLDPNNNPVGDTAMVQVTVLVVGGDYMQIDSPALILAGLQTGTAWLIPVILSLVGIGFVLVRRNR